MSVKKYSDDLQLVFIGALMGFAFGFPFAIEADKMLAKSSSSDFMTLFSAGFGAVIGATVGGIISWLLAKQTSAETLARDDASRMEEYKSGALSLLLKMQQIANGFHTQRHYIWNALERANRDGRLRDPMWTKVNQQAGSPHLPVYFDAREFIPLMLAKKAELINECALIAQRYNAIEGAMETYSSRREALQSAMLPYSIPDADGQVETRIPPQEARRFELMANEIDGLIKTTYNMISEEITSTSRICDELSDIFKNYFNDGTFVTLALDESHL